MNMKKTMMMFNNYIRHHEIRIHDKVINECVQDYIYLRTKFVEKKSKEEWGWDRVLLVDNTML